MQVIIYQQDNGLIAVVTPAPEFEDQLEWVAEKDVPPGKVWRVIDNDLLPSRDTHDRWVWTDEGPIGVVMPTQEELDATAAEAVRSRRDQLLVDEVDPVVSNPLRWADLSAEQQQAWAAYRRALLDITDQSGFPHSVVWPTKPE